MKIRLLYILYLLSLPLFFTSCDEDTLSVGTSVMPSGDYVTDTTATFSVKSRTQKFGAVIAKSNACMLGSVIDSETRIKTTCDYLAQFHVMEKYDFPVRESIDMSAVSCDMILYIDSYYGDSLAPMLLTVQELGTERVMEENRDYYTDIDPTDYLKENGVESTIAYAVRDMVKDSIDGDLSSSSTYISVKVPLPADYGRYLIEKYFENPDNYKNSYNFIHNVCPGFYVKTAAGLGVMVNVKYTTLNVYFKYNSGEGMVDGMYRMSATEEVIQNTRIRNEIPEALLDSENSTYVTSPAGLYTELTLPVDEIFSWSGITQRDSVSSVMLTVRRYNTSASNVLPQPSTLLMVRKSELEDFFKKERLPDNKSSYVASYSATKNAYEFSNIDNIVKRCRTLRKSDDKDWNKVVLVPITPEYSSATSSLLKVRHAFTLSNARLEGGENGSLKVTVNYSRFGK